MQEIIDKNPAVLENVQSNRFSGPPPLKRGRFNGPDPNFGNLGNRNDFNSMNSNNDFSNPQVIQDLLRLAFISGKNLGEGLASGNNNPFNNSSDSPLSSLNLANGFSGRNFGGGSNNGFERAVADIVDAFPVKTRWTRSNGVPRERLLLAPVSGVNAKKLAPSLSLRILFLFLARLQGYRT
ncbi:hypothetical protein quinque_000234 [Culex quinquefasciatus]